MVGIQKKTPECADNSTLLLLSRLKESVFVTQTDFLLKGKTRFHLKNMSGFSNQVSELLPVSGPARVPPGVGWGLE